ncbi:hypothetical protein BJ546DRAFT_951471 [Cryomyces antarcticus]
MEVIMKTVSEGNDEFTAATTGKESNGIRCVCVSRRIIYLPMMCSQAVRATLRRLDVMWTSPVYPCLTGLRRVPFAGSPARSSVGRLPVLLSLSHQCLLGSSAAISLAGEGRGGMASKPCASRCENIVDDAGRSGGLITTGDALSIGGRGAHSDLTGVGAGGLATKVGLSQALLSTTASSVVMRNVVDHYLSHVMAIARM